MTAQRIIQQIFQQPELARVSIVTLEGVVDEYPYFTAARLLLAQKNYEQYPNLQSPAVKKAQLYSNNPHYFFQFLTGELEKTDTWAPSFTPAPAKEPAPVVKQPVTNWEAITRRESEGELAFMIREREEIRAAIRRMEEQEKEQAQETAVDSGQQAVGNAQPDMDDTAPEAAETDNTIQPAPQHSWQLTVDSEQPEEVSYVANIIQPEQQYSEQPAVDNAQPETADAAPEAADVGNTQQPEPQHSWLLTVDNEQPEEAAPAAVTTAEKEEEALEEPITYATPQSADKQEVEDSWEFTVGIDELEPPIAASMPPVQEEIPEAPAASQPAAEEVKEEPKERPAPAIEVPVNQQTITGAEEPIKIFPLDIPKEETTLTFQPLYTDDYFAYKRLQEPDHAEELNEKGMADMRSFTDWLREMKQSFAKRADKDWYHQQLHRLYVDDEPEVSEAVEKMAMESITLNDDIVSETLAEIWARQHQYQTAIQIYQKLSLLNPNKSAYFAQKIQELQLAQSEADKS